MRLLTVLFSSVVAVALILSSTGVTINQHWCGDTLMGASIWGKAEPCSHFKAATMCKIHPNMVLQGASNCCDEESQTIKGSDVHYVASGVLDVDFPTTTTLLSRPVLVTHLNDPMIPVVHFRNHSPPLIGPKRIVWVQSFLI